MASAWRVGAFVVVFVVLLFGSMAVLRRSVFAPRTWVAFAEFADAAGVSSGSPIYFAGVRVGTVDDVTLTAEGKAKMTMALDSIARIPSDVVATVPASLITIGDTKVLLNSTGGSSAALAPNATIPGRIGSALDSLGFDSSKTLDELNGTLVALRQLLEDKELKSGVKGLIASLDATTKKFGGVAGRVDTLIARNQGQVERSLMAASQSLQNLQAVSVEVRKLVASGELQGKAGKLFDGLEAAIADGRLLVGDLRALANDPAMKGSLEGSLANVKVMTDSGTRIAADAEIMAKNGVKASEEAVALMRKANELAEKVDSLVQKFNRTVDDLGGKGKSMAAGIEVEATVTAESKPGRLRTDLNATVPIGKEKLVVGLWDAFESNRVNLQFQKELRKGLAVRYGVYASKPGVGVDYELARKLGFRADLFGLNDPRLDARFRLDFGGSVSGWAGVDRIFERNSPSIGVTVRK